MNKPPIVDCAYCIDGFQPIGNSPDLGVLYRACTVCIDNDVQPLCTVCQGLAVYPGEYSCLHCLMKHLAGRGLVAVLCHECEGVLGLLPIAAVRKALEDG